MVSRSSTAPGSGGGSSGVQATPEVPIFLQSELTTYCFGSRALVGRRDPIN